jgi:hypothetical protein
VFVFVVIFFYPIFSILVARLIDSYRCVCASISISSFIFYFGLPSCYLFICRIHVFDSILRDTHKHKNHHPPLLACATEASTASRLPSISARFFSNLLGSSALISANARCIQHNEAPSCFVRKSATPAFHEHATRLCASASLYASHVWRRVSGSARSASMRFSVASWPLACSASIVSS